MVVDRKGFVFLGLFSLLLRETAGVISDSTEGSAHILSFAFETWNPTTEEWRGTTDIKKGDYIRLVCLLDDELLSDTFTIRKLNKTNSLEPLEHPTKRQIVYDIGNLDCSNSGSYVCEGGNGVSRSLDLSIFDCLPQIQSFTFENWDPVKEEWTSTTDIERGKDVRLICTIGGSTSENLIIKKVNGLKELEPLQYPNNRQVVHAFQNLECDKAGEYVCEDENGLRKMLEFNISGCSSEILSFTFEEWDPLHQQWRTTTDIEKGKDIRLTCTISGPFSKTFSIKNLDETNVPMSLEYPNSRQISHTIIGVDCDKFGTYVCDNGLGASRRTELGIFKCAPRFCEREQESALKTVMRFGEHKTFSVCVEAFPDINVAMVSSSTEAKTSAENRVSDSHRKTSSKEADEKAANSEWGIEVELKPDTFGESMIKISKTISSVDDYGEHTLIISTTHKGSRKELNYTINVTQPSDSDDCPTDLNVTELEAENLKLSWKPRVETVDAQYFVVFVSENEKEWVSYGKETQESLHIAGLQDDTQYAFRVVPVKQDKSQPNGNECHNTFRVKTATFVGAVSHRPSISVAVIILMVAVVVLSIVIVIAVCKVIRYRQNRQNKKCPPDSEGGQESLVTSHL